MMRMEDVFNLPVTKEREVCVLEDRTPIMIAAILLNKEYVFHAINSHDQLLDTIAEKDKVIGELLDLLECFYPYADYDENGDEVFLGGDFHYYEDDEGLGQKVMNVVCKYKQSKGE